MPELHRRRPVELPRGADCAQRVNPSCRSSPHPRARAEWSSCAGPSGIRKTHYRTRPDPTPDSMRRPNPIRGQTKKEGIIVTWCGTILCAFAAPREDCCEPAPWCLRPRGGPGSAAPNGRVVECRWLEGDRAHERAVLLLGPRLRLSLWARSSSAWREGHSAGTKTTKSAMAGLRDRLFMAPKGVRRMRLAAHRCTPCSIYLGRTRIHHLKRSQISK